MSLVLVVIAVLIVLLCYLELTQTRNPISTTTTTTTSTINHQPHQLHHHFQHKRPHSSKLRQTFRFETYSEEPKFYCSPNEWNRAVLQQLTEDPRATRFQPTWWCTNGHAQTLATSMLRKRRATEIVLRREYIECPDGGAVALDWDRGSCIPSSTVKHDDDRPFLLILHGVFGGSEENYVRQIAWSAKQNHSLRYAILNFRGAGTSVLRTPKAYCAGATEDVRLVLRLLKARCSPRTKLYAVGYSMGANVLVKYLGEEGSKTPLSAAVAVSNPFKLLTSAYALQSSSLGMVYSRAIATAARKFTRRHQHMLEMLSRETNATSSSCSAPSSASSFSSSASPVIGKELVKGALSAKTLWDFDRDATAQMWGFPSVESYYYESSSALFVPNIQVPLLCINALDDPLVPQQCLPYEEIMKSESVVLLTTEKGGHVAWLEDNSPFALNSSWADFMTLRYLSVIHRLLYAPSSSSSSSFASPSSSLRNVSGSTFFTPKTKQEQEQFSFASLFPSF